MTEFVLVEQRPAPGTRHQVTGPVTIGREGCDITLADTEVSRRHARVAPADGRLMVEDLGSTNGTFVNGRRLDAPAELRHGDVVAVGNSELGVEVVADAGATRIRTSPEPAAAPAATGARGDVPAPAPASASRVHAAVAPAAAPPQAEFRPQHSSGGRRRGSAATRTEATLISYGVVLTTAAAIAVYLVQR